MKNKHLEVFEELKKQLLNFPRDTLYDKYLDAIVSAQLKKIKYSDDGFEPEKLSRQYVYAKAKGVNEDTVDGQTAKNSIKTTKLNLELNNFIHSQPDCKQAFDNIGYMPIVIASLSSGGAKNRALLWMDIEAVKDDSYELEQILDTTSLEIDEEIEDDEDLSFVTYERRPESEIKPSLFTKLFFKKGKLKLRSFSGMLLMLLLMLSFVADILIAIFSILVILLLSDLPSFRLWQVMVLLLLIPVAYLNWRYFFMPLYVLPHHRVIKAPMFFANINVDNADIEMYRNKDKLNIARITEFTATCPICSGVILLANGKPDQMPPLVGRCKEAPHAHVYSFDRMTMKGYFLGAPN
ncbi:hypothetical protein [Psychrobacter glacincola]|uniref:hypothetical protein n=1 Tax=Psychrobacter glacincola TaxID=56810 RepID=UPI0039AF2A49